MPDAPMEHERLDKRVPQICEICCAPVGGTFKSTKSWPGAGGIPVYIHAGACWDTAERHMDVERKRRRPW